MTISGLAIMCAAQHHYALYARVKTFLQEYTAPQTQVRLEPEYILAFFRSVYWRGIQGVERVPYWKLVLWSLFRRPNLFPLAITLTIYGYHFRQVVELHIQ